MAPATRRTRPWRSARRGPALFLVTAALALTTLPAVAAVCHGCEDPTIPDNPGGPSCPTVTASVDPAITTPAPFRVGGTVQATRGTWGVTGGSITGYSAGLYAGTGQVATKSNVGTTVSFEVPASALDKRLRVRITASTNVTGCAKTEYSAETATAVVKGVAPSLTGAGLQISGTRVVGATLTAAGAQAGSWTPAADGVTYEWRRGATTVGTAQTYTLKPADVGAGNLKVVATAKRNGHEDGVRETSVGTVAPGALQNTTVTLDATSASVGTPISVVRGTWAPATADRLSITWLRGSTPIPGATSATYVPIAADAGRSLSAKVTATGVPGYSDRTVQSAGVVVAAVVGPPALGSLLPAVPWRGKTPRITGKDRVKAKVKTLKPGKIRKRLSAPSAVVSYQWLRNGKAIKGATRATYKVKRADRRKKLRVRIVVTLPGHQPLTVTTAKVRIKSTGRALR